MLHREVSGALIPDNVLVISVLWDSWSEPPKMDSLVRVNELIYPRQQVEIIISIIPS